jgi:hypothetical protein
MPRKISLHHYIKATRKQEQQIDNSKRRTIYTEAAEKLHNNRNKSNENHNIHKSRN